MPRRRADFARRIDDRRRTIAHESGYVQRYPLEVMRFAEEEMRSRNHAAAGRIKELIDSGWTPPNPTAVRAAFTACFQHSDYREDPFSDIYERVEKAYEEIGQPVPQGVSLRSDIGDVQVQVVNECLSDLEMYVPKRDRPSTTFDNYAPVGAQQVGHENVANVNQTMTSMDRTTIATAMQTIRSHVGDFPEDDKQEGEEYLASIDEELSTSAPRASRLKTWFTGIARIAAPLARSGVKTATEAAVAAVIKSLMGGV